MGWDVDLVGNDGESVQVRNHCEGGIIAIGGTPYASISVTWNYSHFYYETLDKKMGFRWLNGKKAEATINRLEKAVKKLGTETDANYWNATKGNAGHILAIMLEWAKLNPKATWEIT